VRTLAEWLALQESVHPKAIDMGLARVRTVARTLGVDKPACPVITVGGTNGKGSVVAHLEALFRAAGASTGMFTSPHFIRYNERIRVDGAEVGDSALIAAFERIEAARGATTLTFFEYNTLAALLIFAERAVDLAILEVGLGGRLDATNLVDADVGVVCSIGFDHRDWLGESLELIGAEKAGIFRSGQPAVLGTDDMPASVFSAIERMGARAVIAGRDFTWRVEEKQSGPARWRYDGLTLSLRDLPPSVLAGSIQYRNAATAIAAVEALSSTASAVAKLARNARPASLALDQRIVSEALGTVRLAGRFHVVPGAVEWILDIAHNEPAAEVFARHVRERPLPSPVQGTLRQGRGGGRTIAVVGILGDKDAKAIAGALEPLVDHWILCSLPGPRGVSAEMLAQRLTVSSDRVTLADSVEHGCELARATARPGDRVLVFGSVYTVGPALQWLGIY
jgi:dihydrofolate synthase / folylpolyglutamate synthase